MEDKRKEVIEQLRGMNTLFSTDIYEYEISHTYGGPQDRVYIRCKIEPDVMDVLVYSFQDRLWDICEEHSLFPKDVAFLLQKFFGAEESTSNTKRFVIDIHENWEVWTSLGREIISLPVLQNTNLHDALVKVYQEASDPQERCR
ncbi:hypothetical protein AM501_09860 [Aneurinibacillus migulanus]|uniref:hypothetical protein n=1 Tax=Aneurinibacillus migulanus TaxID=47500 RepID=UPI0005BCC656|nr:hypothetical protein [Aneurinibacillus migulanus]KIV56450.1 hypothetical protein TS64_09275 [Aneurinibacillus migulanus]KPD08458.1 hypothetical protein AM501_09860 [Aneurinibacillus migulanus]